MAPMGLYQLLKSYYTGQQEPEKPVISTTAVVVLLILYTLVYVLPFYLHPSTRPSPTLSRDAPSVIRGRIRSVTISCLLCSLSTFAILSSLDSHGSPIKTLHFMGYFPLGFDEICKTLALTAIAFLGPLFEKGYVDGGWRDWIRLRGLDVTIGGWIGYRNYIAGPVTEEILFRSTAVPLLLLAHVSTTKIIFLAPIIFGLAHIHHFYEFRLTHPHTPILAAFLRSLLQFSYTTLFGAYVTFLYLRTSSLASVILVHAFCNWMGLPRFWGRVGCDDGAETVMGPDVVGGGKRADDVKLGTGETYAKKGSLLSTVVYYVLLVGGAVAFWKSVWTLTESESALTSF